MNKLIVRVEEGSIYYDTHEGDWLTEGQLDWLTSVFEDEVGPSLDMEPNADTAIKASREDPDLAFLITINNPHCEQTGGYWNMDYGYVNDEIFLSWDGPVEIQELT